MGSVALVNDFGKLESKSDSWPTLDYQVTGYRVSFRDTVYRTDYDGIGFTMTLKSAEAEVKKSANPGIYLVKILGGNVADVYHLKNLVYRKLGFEKVEVFPPIIIKQSSIWGRLLWLLTGRIE